MYIAVTVIAAMLLGVGFVLQQHAASKLPYSYLHLRLIAQLLRQRIWLGGIAVMVVGQGLSAWGLGHLSLTVSEPLLATNLIFALLLAAPISGEIPRRTELVGAVLLCTGVAALSASRSVRALSESFGSFSHWPAAAIIAGVAAALAIAGRSLPRRLRATLTGASGGLVLGIADALTRRSVEMLDGHGIAALATTWPGYAVIGTAAVGLWLVQSAFSAGPLHASLPAITAAEPLAGMTLGVLVFGDVVHVSPLLLALQAAGIAAMVAGTVLVARAPMFVKLTLQPVGDHHLPKLHVTVGPPADGEIEPSRDAAAMPPGQAEPAAQEHESGPNGANAPVPAERGAATARSHETASASPSEQADQVSSPVTRDPGPASTGPTMSAAARTVRGVPADAVLAGVQGTGIRPPGLTERPMLRVARPWQLIPWQRIPWQRIAGLVISRLRVQKVPPPPAAR